MIRLGIDSRDIFQTHPRGIGKALRALVTHLMPLVPDWQVALFTNRTGAIGFSKPASIKKIDVPGDRVNAWENIRLPLSALTNRLDLLHCPSQSAPPFNPCPVVLTVHDLIPIRIDDGWSPAETERFGRNLLRDAAKARRIIAVSEFTKNDLVAFCRIPEEKVDVVHWGVFPATPLSGDEDWELFSDSVGIVSPYFVAFGGDAPRKNVFRLLQAFASLAREVSRDVQLLLLGVPEQARSKFADSAEALGLSKAIVQLGYVPDTSVRLALAHSEALVYPSLYEGFGLPILEAMAVGTPVITSNVSSMPEIAGDAAILVDPLDPGAISAAMRECYLDDRAKNEMRANGYRRVASFTWEKTAAATRLTYERALNLNV